MSLGLIYYNERKNQEAQQALEDAISMYGAQVEKYPELTHNLAVSYLNLGDAALVNKQTQKAYTAYGEALVLYRKLLKKDSDNYLPPLTNLLATMAEIDLTQKRNKEAYPALEEAADNYRKLSAKDAASAQLYAKKLASVLSQLGYLNLTNKPQLAESLFTESLAIYRPLAVREPLYLHDLASVQVRLAMAFNNQRKTVLARPLMEEAIANYRKLVQQKPELTDELIFTLSQLGELNLKEFRIDDARKMYAEILALCRQQIDKNPATEKRKLAWVLARLGTFNIIGKDLIQARIFLNEAISIYRLDYAQRSDTANEFAMALYGLGLLNEADNRASAAIKAFSEASTLLQDQKQLSLAQQAELGKILHSLATVEFTEERLKDAQEHVNAALAVRRQLAKNDTEAEQQDLIDDLALLSSIHMLNKDLPRVRQVYAEIAQLAERTGSLPPKTQARVDVIKLFIKNTKGL